jgi:hypothetical protein
MIGEFPPQAARKNLVRGQEIFICRNCFVSGVIFASSLVRMGAAQKTFSRKANITTAAFN